ncbi:hypothetical protein [Burkholderia cepacia]|uniref:hypothetical protein n=1 Tax=Burkholderia cepacia TaxID=292 RepID=UPI00158DA1C1|nr:hypothetical protein [Burkholderia cepacia]MCA8054357.1 hypothetical protein [Burkholderia cepacia]
MKNKQIRVTVVSVASAAALLAASLSLYASHVREDQKQSVSRDLMYASRTVEAVLKMDRTRSQQDIAVVSNNSEEKFTPRMPPKGLAAMFESERLNDLSLGYAENGLKAIQLISKKNAIELQLQTTIASNIFDPNPDSRWKRRAALKGFGEELRPVAEDLVQALRRVQQFGARIEDQIGDIGVPASEIEMGIRRYRALSTSGED